MPTLSLIVTSTDHKITKAMV